jgi:hypothetical protein
MATKKTVQRRTRTVSNKEYPMWGFLKDLERGKLSGTMYYSPANPIVYLVKRRVSMSMTIFVRSRKWSDWEVVQNGNFIVAIQRAVDFCKAQSINVNDHFHEVTKMVEIGKGGKREVSD